MKRRLFAFLAVVSFVMVFAVSGLWLRSHYIHDDWLKTSVADTGVPNVITATFTRFESWDGRCLLESQYTVVDVRAYQSAVAEHWLDEPGYCHRTTGLLSTQLKPTSVSSPLSSWMGLEIAWPEDVGSIESRTAGIAVPFGWLVALFAFAPLAWLVRLCQQRKADRAGHCPNCGYDLRATPDRCPECGAVPINAKS